jgi:hypothetical protein
MALSGWKMAIYHRRVADERWAQPYCPSVLLR